MGGRGPLGGKGFGGKGPLPISRVTFIRSCFNVNEEMVEWGINLLRQDDESSNQLFAEVASFPNFENVANSIYT